jgi:hypothetical protein
MKRVTRRTALAALSVSGVAALVPVTRGAGPEAVAAKHELFVVGPFSLGDWFKKYREERKAKGTIVYGAPDDAEIIKSLNDCKLYVIDQRVWKDKDTPRFGDSKDGYPHLVASGKLIHTWKEKGKNCTIWVKELKAPVDSRNDVQPSPRCRILLHVALNLEGTNGVVTQTATHEFSRNLVYDITGKELPGEK